MDATKFGTALDRQRRRWPYSHRGPKTDKRPLRSIVICPACSTRNRQRLWCRECHVRFYQPYVQHDDPLLVLLTP